MTRAPAVIAVSAGLILLLAACTEGGEGATTTPATEGGLDAAPAVADLDPAELRELCGELHNLSSFPPEARRLPDEALVLAEELRRQVLPPAAEPELDAFFESLRALVTEDLNQVASDTLTDYTGEASFIAFMEPDGTDERIRAVEVDLRTHKAVAEFIYFDQAQAYDEFRSLFADEPELVESVSPDILPPSFRIVVNDGVDADVQELVDLLESTEVVREVVVGPIGESVDNGDLIGRQFESTWDSWDCATAAPGLPFTANGEPLRT